MQESNCIRVRTSLIIYAKLDELPNSVGSAFNSILIHPMQRHVDAKPPNYRRRFA
jgi:hypothetical protein